MEKATCLEDPETVAIATQLIEKLAAIRCDCETAVYTSLLRDRILDVIDVLGILLETIIGHKPAASPSEYMTPTEQLNGIFKEIFPKQTPDT